MSRQSSTSSANVVDGESLPVINPGRQADPDYRALERLTGV